MTLWADVAESSCSLSPEALPLPIVIAFTSLKVKLYLGFQVVKTLSRYCPSSRQVNEAEILHTAKKLIIDELAFLDLDLYMDDTFLCKASVTSNTAKEPATSQPLAREITVSSTAMSSCTSTPETRGTSNKRKRESIRKTLFTAGEQSELEEISEVSPKQFDEVPLKCLKKKKKSPSGIKTDTTLKKD
ncbi:uncharacterized protein LOC125470880 [Pyrus x bretschneideri]|uniref:uncharacterized protein LOC125470880 n=1 Tax=Pyrus x bretschneideri TaxID=225117 RepID=UPI00202F7F85|nr:uncharacterized protein LOC125470880 [Pyrus x bretschneideri]